MVVVIGDGVMLTLIDPVFQVYVLAPPAVNVAVPPTHIVAEFTLTVGKGFTVTVAVFEEEHPFVVPFTV